MGVDVGWTDGSPASILRLAGRGYRTEQESEMAHNGKTVTITDDNFAGEIEQAQGLALIDFWAAWCGPCRMVAPIVEELAKEYEGQVKVGKLDVDQNQRTATKFNIRSIPSILFFKDGQLVDQVVGAVPKPALEKKIKEHL
jgi:thioredoxin 1